MADDRDILGKADALLRRHVPLRAGSGDGTDVPVLTELITPGGNPVETAPLSESAPEPGAVRETAVAREAPAVEPPQEPDGRDEEFRRRLVADVTNTVRSRLAHDIERHLAAQVLTQTRASVAAALGDLHPEIARAVDIAVAEALKRNPNR